MKSEEKENYAFIASWIRRKISFALPNSLCTCLSGSRSVYYIPDTYSENSLSSFAKVSEDTSYVDGTLLPFWVSYITYTACYYCVKFNIVISLHCTADIV